MTNERINAILKSITEENSEKIIWRKVLKMDDSGPTASIIIYVVLLLIDVFFYGFGAALDSLNEKEVERRAQEEKDKKSVKLLKLLSNSAESVNTVQLITTLVNVIIGAVHLTIPKGHGVINRVLIF